MTTLMTAPPATAPAVARRAPSWERPALALLLLGTALLYLWDLGASGYANSFYAQAVQAGTQSWKAMLFGSLDAGNAITVDKPALFLWPMEISARLFGFSSWSMLVPQALEGVATVALAYGAVRRLTASAAWGLVAGALLALTPVAVLMFRFNNPDAMLVLLLTGAAYAVVRALEHASARWLCLAGALVGLGFITKMGQALLVVPALGLAYLVAAPTGLVARVRHLLLSLVALVLGAGWWVALVTWWPGAKPWIGGSTDGTELDLALGYNGLGRLFGNGQGGGPGGAGGPGGNGGFGGATGLGRLFRSDMATEASWLLPGALLALLLGLYLTWDRPRTDRHRAGLLVFGGSLLVTGLVFSEMKGVIHPYYTVALAPLMAGVLAVTGSLVWQLRSSLVARAGAAVVLETTVLWDVHLLGAWQPALKALVVLASIGAVTALVWGPAVRRVAVAGVVAALVAGVGGSAAYAVSTASHPHTGSIPSSGPVASSLGGRGGTSTNAELVALLKATSTTWAAATDGTQSSAPLQLASGKQVLAIGGFNGGDDAPTLAQFQTWVAEGRVSYYVSGGQGGFGGGPGGRGGAASQIASWVAAHYTATTVGGSTVYDLRASS